jgi:hypothetical protein
VNNTAKVYSLGKLFYRKPKSEPYSILPDLNFLIFNHPDNDIYSYTAVCIQLELDVCGNSVKEVKDNLLKAIALYCNAQARSCNSFEDFAEKFIDTIFDYSTQKEELFRVYQNAKCNYLKSLAQKNTVQMPKTDPSNVAPFIFKKNMELSPVMVV